MIQEVLGINSHAVENFCQYRGQLLHISSLEQLLELLQVLVQEMSQSDFQIIWKTENDFLIIYDMLDFVSHSKSGIAHLVHYLLPSP